MPRYRTNEIDKKWKNIYRDFCNPITKGFREELYVNILKTYESTEFDEMYVRYNQGEVPDKLVYEERVVIFEKEEVQ